MLSRSVLEAKYRKYSSRSMEEDLPFASASMRVVDRVFWPLIVVKILSVSAYYVALDIHVPLNQSINPHDLYHLQLSSLESSQVWC